MQLLEFVVNLVYKLILEALASSVMPKLEN